MFRRWLAGGVCTSPAKLDGKTVIITGGNTGIGKETAIDLAKRGAKVIIACRNEEKAREALDDIKRETTTDVVFKKLDLASLKSVRDFASSILSSEDRLDILVNNAGIMMCPRMTTEDGFEMQFGVNHLGHFLLTNLLLDLIKKSAPSRIVNVSSLAHGNGRIKFDDINSEKSYGRVEAYCQSKLANVLFTRELKKRLEGTGVSVFALHPGLVRTELTRHVYAASKAADIFFYPVEWLFYKTSREGAQTSIYCSVQEGIENLSGRYFSDCAEKRPSRAGRDDAAALALWELSEKMVGMIKE